MTTTPTTRETNLARRMRIDLDTATYPLSEYEQLMAIRELKLIQELRSADGESYDDAGAMREDVTGYNWRVEGKILHSSNPDGTVLDEIHAFLRTKFHLARLSGAASGEFGVRWYDRTGLDDGDSVEGRCYVKSLSGDGGQPGAQDLVSFVLQGQGPLALITNPAGSLLPGVTGVTPATGGAAGGNLVTIMGHHFSTVTGATGVKFGATNATSYVILSDTKIVAIAPAHAAGSVQVLITNPTGASPNVAADDYVYV